MQNDSTSNHFSVTDRFYQLRSWRAGRAGLVLLSVLLLLNLALPATLTQAQQAHADEFVRDEQAEELFVAIWDKADGPIAASRAARSWLWGPNSFLLTRENYAEAPGGKRYVAYFDKARMELTRPATSQVSNGLLVVEMMLGKFQDGDSVYVDSPEGPATLNVVGDPGNWLTYARLASFASLHNDQRAANRTNQNGTVDEELTEAGSTQRSSTQAGRQTLAFYESTLGHNVPEVFWSYLNQNGVIYDTQQEKFVQGQPINWLADAGFPITEAYWVRQKVGGVERDVMVQAFQRRTLTYTPSNPLAYQVEMGNVGRHYTRWGYKQDFGNPPTLEAPVEAAPVPPVTTPPPPPPTAQPPASRPVTGASSPCYEGQIKGNRNSGIYHVPGQRFYAVTKNNVECFNSESAAQAAGYRRSKV